MTKKCCVLILAATVVALVLRLPRLQQRPMHGDEAVHADKFRLLLEDPLLCRYLLEVVAQRCDDAWTQMEVIGCTHVRDKVRSGLLWLSGRFGVQTDIGVRIDLNQTRLARMVGCARETLSRELQRLISINAIDVRYDNGQKFFYVVDPDELSQPS